MFVIHRSILIFLLIIKTIGGQDEVSQKSSVIRLCSVCTCSEISTELDADVTSDVILNVQCSEIDRIQSLPDLHKIQWPDNPNGLKIAATFRDLSLSTLGKLPPNPWIETLYFNNNAIKTYWSDPFSDLPNLKELSFSQNDLVEITQDLFTNIPKLEILDLSYNKLVDFNKLDFAALNSLKKLNLQSNLLKKIPVESLQHINTLEELDLSKNGIYDLLLQRSDSDALRSVKRLSLGGNRIRSVMKHSFPESNALELLDLSNNIIENVEDESFLTCNNLRELNLGQNNLTVTFALPSSLQIVILRQNALHRWPVFPSGIKYIDLSLNRIDEMYNENNVAFDNLEVLNIAGNHLKEFSVQNKLPNLFSLDLSYNLLQEVPASLSGLNFPSLEELKLDGNKIHTIYFKNIISLKYLHMNDLDSLNAVEEKAFVNVVGKNMDSFDDVGNGKNCYSLYISNCKSLTQIDDGAFEGASLCLLDLSNNGLSELSETLISWSEVREGVNLQGNPWDCSCPLQWMLDTLLPDMYQRHPQLLNDFRCKSPRAVQGLRLVHWYNWTGQAMCNGANMRSGSHESYMLDPTATSDFSFFSGSTSMAIVLGVCAVVGLLIIIGMAVYLVRSHRRERVRRVAATKKRHSNHDRKSANSVINREQYTALNRV